MRWLKKYELFKESKNTVDKPNAKNIVRDICVSMVLLNNEFLDNILDRGLKARYSEDSHVFLTDLKNLLLAKNRLNLGKFIENKCVADEEISKVNGLFDSIEFNIEEDWKLLVDARTIARSIIDKLMPDEKLESDRIKYIFWIFEKDKEHGEDIVLETADGQQYSFFLNKNLTSQKSASFNLFADDLIGENLDKLFKEEYLSKWDKLTQEWVKVIYENANKNIQQHIEKFVDPNRIGEIGYFEYFDIRHRDPRFKHLGEFIKDFNKNILKFSDLMSEIWKNREICFMDSGRVFREWSECKIMILNSRILEHLLTSSLKSTNADDIIKQEDGFKLANGSVKMKLFKTLVEKIGCLERPVYFLGNNGNYFYHVPDRQFFRDFYDDITIKFDYHVQMIVNEDADLNDFNIKIILEMENKPLINMNIFVKFTGSEMSGKLSAKYKFELDSSFNYLVSKKKIKD